jgi:hypothetical protein
VAMLGTLYRGALARTVLGVVAVALVPWPATAADTTPPPRPSLRTALAEVRTRDLTPPRPSQAPARRSQQVTNPATQSASFFKTRTGVIVAAVAVAGAGYAIYSAQHDRIHSPGKK